MKKERYYELDAARGLGILLVVLGHIWDNESPASIWIYSFHIPLFFLISGSLIRLRRSWERPFAVTVKKLVRGLLVPYAGFEILFILLFGILNHFRFDQWEGHLYGALLLAPKNTPLWFLPCLLIAQILLLLLLKWEPKGMLAGILAVLVYTAALILGPAYTSEEGIASLFRCMMAYAFLYLGYLLAPFFQKKKVPVFVCLLLLFLEAILAIWNGKTGIYKLTWNNPFLFTICALIGSGSVLMLLSQKRIPALELPGTHTIPILGLHIILLRILQKLLPFSLTGPISGVLTAAVICTILTMGAILVQPLYQK